MTNDIETCPPIILNIWDQEAGIINTKDYLGRAVIPMESAMFNLTMKMGDNLKSKIF